MHCYYTPIVYRRFLFQKHWLLCVLINLQESADELINNSINPVICFFVTLLRYVWSCSDFVNVINWRKVRM